MCEQIQRCCEIAAQREAGRGAMALRSSSRAWQPSRHAPLGPQGGYPEDEALERPVHATQQPSDPERDRHGCIGLSLDGVADRLLN